MNAIVDFPRMVDIVPEARSGDVRVEHFEVSEEQAKFSRLRAALGHDDEAVEPGKYASLKLNGHLVMSDTRMERESNVAVVRAARGRVLVAGLGLGMILHPILAKPEVDHVVVIEKSKDVIDLIAPTLPARGLAIVCADVFSWKPPKGTKWDTIYFDIWGSISTDSLKEMNLLHGRFSRRLNAGGWMDSWKRRQLMREARRGW